MGSSDRASTVRFGVPQPDKAESVAPAAPPDPLVGGTVGSFKVVRLLGKGGMGTVYLAEHPAIGSKVAVKFLNESMASEPQTVARFYDEARAVNLIGHENIVGIYDLNLLPPRRYYYVMEYLEGSTLAALEKAGRVETEVALDILLQLCDALQCAHECGVVHRDLKPENVFLVQRRGKAHFVKLVDFGIAKLRGAGRASGRTELGVIVGTPGYMAPEQCEDGTIDARTDVYALGVMAFELATGQLPFQGRSVTQLLLAHLQKPPPKPSELAPVDPVFERAILRALEKDPGARFPDMASFAEALRAVPREPAPRPAPRGEGGQPAVSTSPLAAKAPTAPTAPPALVAELLADGAAPASFSLVELTRAGLFLAAEEKLPPLFAKVKVLLSHPSLRGKVEVLGEVVRHVAPADAAAVKMPPGFAVQFTDPPPEVRAALGALADELRRETGPHPAPQKTVSPDERLRLIEARSGRTHYDLLGLPPDAEFGELRRVLKALHDELENYRLRPTAADHPFRAAVLLGRVEAAQAALGSPPARLAYDAQRGNYKGVARCVAAGVPSALVAARRRELLEAAPQRAQEAQRQLARAQVARRMGNAPAALLAYEAALVADPLDVGTYEALSSFRREIEKGGMTP